MHLLLNLAAFALYCTLLVWVPHTGVLYVCKRLKREFPERCVFYWRTLKWPSLAGIISMWLTGLMTTGTIDPTETICYGIMLAYWVFMRNIGKDNEPKERKRIRARIKQIGARLVVVPEVVTA